jgi:hypothetical protein
MELPRNLGLAVVAVPFGVARLRRAPAGTGLLFSCAWIALACALFSSLYNVLDVESYFLPALVAVATLAAVGLDRWAARRAARWLFPLSVAALLAANFGQASLRGDRIGREYGDDLLRSTPADAILLSFGDTATHALWYLQDVEGQRSDVTSVSVDELSDWYLAKLTGRTGIDWPPPDPDRPTEWLGQLASRNVRRRHVCLTQPVDLGPPGWMPLPHGLVFCLGEAPAIPLVAKESVRFWQETEVPGTGKSLPRDIHEKMAIFSYGLARYNLIRLLVAADMNDQARAQARELVATDPDRVEQAVEEALLTIGKAVPERFDFGARSEKLLALPASDRASALRLLDL